MIMPLAGLSICGALFYQGENNSFGEGWVPFQETFPALIADWPPTPHHGTAVYQVSE